MKKIIPAHWIMLCVIALVGFSGGATAVSTAPVQCTAGTAANLNKDACVTCPKGTYTDYDGAQCTSTSLSSCIWPHLSTAGHCQSTNVSTQHRRKFRPNDLHSLFYGFS